MDNHKNQQKIAIIGLGFVGLPLALLFVAKGRSVIGIDVDENKIKSLYDGKSYISDIKNSEVQEGIESGLFKATSQFDQIKEAEAIIICVPTPLKADTTPNLEYVKSAVQSIQKYLQKGQLVVLESSTFPGTTREVVKPILEQDGLIAGRDFYLAYSPERVDPGSQFPIDVIPKVVGGLTDTCKGKIQNLYSKVYKEVVPVSTPETAELTKLLENTYRFINISFINEMAIICDQIGVNVWEVINAASTKPYGFETFYPGPGIGGHCIPVDPLYLQFIIKKIGLTSQFIELSEEMNDKIVQYIIDRSLALTKKETASEANILIYGVTYKRDVADVRESRSLDIIAKLLEKDANVSYHDPLVSQLEVNGKKLYSSQLLAKVVKESDCVVVLTNHSELPKEFLLEHANIIFDTRGVFEGASGKATVIQLGNGGKLKGC